MYRALLSVYDKTGLVEFATVLVNKFEYELVASGGTAKALTAAGLPVTPVEELTGSPECLGGRVKTLHPAIHAGILADKHSKEHTEQLEYLGYKPFDLVVCNLYPFQETVDAGKSAEEVIENIDIGGVALIRAAAKNHPSLAVLTNPDQYDLFLERGHHNDRLTFAKAAFKYTASYDLAISNWFVQHYGHVLGIDSHKALPDYTLKAAASLAKVSEPLRYGENSHQRAYIHKDKDFPFQQIQGEKELGYNNWLDLDAAWATVRTFGNYAVAVVKHTNPCGVAVDLECSIEALGKALASDPVSSFGSIIASNTEVETAFVKTLGKLFVEVIVAPRFTAGALDWLRKHKKNCRVVQVDLEKSHYLAKRRLDVRSMLGGMLTQEPDRWLLDQDWKTIQTHPPVHRSSDVIFAWKVVRHVKSNAIVLVKDGATVGIGAGQMNRVQAVKLAIEQAGDRAKGAVLASDAFFPFPDSVELAAKAGVEWVIQPGGSIRDKEVIEAAKKHGISMTLTGIRHFKH